MAHENVIAFDVRYDAMNLLASCSSEAATDALASKPEGCAWPARSASSGAARRHTRRKPKVTPPSLPSASAGRDGAAEAGGKDYAERERRASEP